MPYLAEEVREILSHVDDEDQPWDPNDLIIFYAFVLPVLEDHPEGFDSSEMLDKGFGFLIGLIPALLNQRRAEMDPAHFGMLARLFHRHSIERILHWIDRMDDAWYEENLPGLYRDLDFLQLIRTRTKP